MEPKLVVRKDEKYFELKVERKDLEKLLNGKQILGRDEAIAITDKIETERVEMLPGQLKMYGGQMPFKRKFTSDTKTMINGKMLIGVIDDFFGSTKTYATVYRAPYVMIENLKIYDRVFGEDNTYYIGGFAQLLK